MAGSRPGDLPDARIAAAALLLGLLAPALAAQPLFNGRPEDQPSVSRRVAALVRATRGVDESRRGAALPHLLQVAQALRTREFGRVLEGLARATAAAEGRPWSPVLAVRSSVCTLSLPEVQAAGPGAKIHITARLLVTRKLPEGLSAHFRVVDPLSGRVMAESPFTGTFDTESFCRYEVTHPFDVSSLPPGRWLGEVHFKLAGRALEPALAVERCAFYLVDGFKERWASLVGAYRGQDALVRKSQSPPWRRRALHALVAPLGEVDRAINPNRGGYPLVDLDQGFMVHTAGRWVDLMAADRDPLAGLQGDQLVGVSAGKVMPMRLHIPPGLPPAGQRRALLFLPDSTGGRSDLATVHGRGVLPRLAARHRVIVACLHSGYMPGGKDLLGAARQFLVDALGVSPRGVTLGGHGRGASQAYYGSLDRSERWAGLVMVSGPPANPGRLAPVPGGRTFYLEGAANPALRYLVAAREAARRGEVRFETLPLAEHILALADGLERVIAFAGDAPLKP